MRCPGYRISLNAVFGRMKDKIQVDLGLDDAVNPIMREMHFFQYRDKPVFESEVSLLVYPPETIFAEKLETVISKGPANSRMKDYHNLLLLIREPNVIDFSKLQATLKSTFYHRSTDLQAYRLW